MKILTKDEVFRNINFYIKEMKVGKIFIYPTDTVYGIGCVGNLDDSVLKIFKIKNREKKPLLVIVPNIEWIEDNLIATKQEIEYMLNNFSKQCSFILKLKNKECISKYINNNGDKIGIRYPNNWFCEIINKLGIPFVTTSVNLSGDNSAIRFEDINPSISNQVDYIIKDDEGMSGVCSKIYDLTCDNKILR